MRKQTFCPAFCTFLAFFTLCVSILSGCTSSLSEPETFQSAPRDADMQLNRTYFGTTPDGQEASLYTLTIKNGVAVISTNYRATVASVMTSDKHGVLGDVVYGFDSLSGYDLNYVLWGGKQDMALAATVNEPESGRELQVYTAQKGSSYIPALSWTAP